MRCATCGTENALDSRFCGGCGARMPDAPRLVPATQKIDDNAVYPTGHPSAPSVQSPNTYQSGPPQMPPSSIPPQNNYSGPAIPQPSSIAPQNNPVKSVPPQSSQPYQPVRSAPPQSSAPYQPVKSAPPQSSAPYQPPATVPPTNNGRSRPPTNDGRSIPPTKNGRSRPTNDGRSIPPTNGTAPQPTGSLGESLPRPAGRRWGLIIFVLLVDLALAGAGAFLLREGLS